MNILYTWGTLCKLNTVHHGHVICDYLYFKLCNNKCNFYLFFILFVQKYFDINN